MALTSPAGQQVVLSDLSWETYQAMLRDLGDERAARLAYDRGTLEIAMPPVGHEIVKHLLERIVTALTLEFGVPVKGAGSVTLSREDLRQSVEPDACYYIEHAHLVRGRRINLATDPPPEVDVTNPSSRKLAIYARLGVPELWRYAEGRLVIYGLEGDAYVERSESPTFRGVTATLVTRWLEQGETADDNTVIRSLRRWASRRG